MLELFKQLGIKYLDRTIYHPQCVKFEKTKLTDYKEYGKASKISSQQFKLFSKQLRENYKAPIYVKWTSDEVGYGVFASEYIPAGSFIAEYAGVVVPKKLVKNRTWSWKYPSKGHFIDSYRKFTSLDGGFYGNEMRFINHSDSRNTSPVVIHDGTTWYNCYYVVKAIAKDQELLTSYGKSYWKNKTKLDL